MVKKTLSTFKSMGEGGIHHEEKIKCFCLL